MSTKDPFSIQIVVRHPSFMPERISEALGIRPQASPATGERLGQLKAQWTYFHGLLQKSDYASEFDRALRKVTSFLKKHSDFFNVLTRGDGEAEIVLNHTINLQEADSIRLYTGARHRGI
jgi:hypothetical protein